MTYFPETRQERKTALRKLLNLPDFVEPFCLIALGYPGESKDTPDRYDPARLHHNHW